MNPSDFKFEFGINASAMIGYSYSKFYECGLMIAKPSEMEDYNFEYLMNLGE